MTDNKSNPLDRAGSALLLAAKHQARASGPGKTNQINVADYQALLAKVRHHLKQADQKVEPHKFAAVRTALEALEATERGDDTFNAVEMFKGHVEAICGGERTFDLGGKRIKNRPSSDVSYLKAAIYVLWNLGCDRDQLVLDAQSLLDFTSRRQLRMFVNNSTHQKPDGSGMPQSTIWAHVPLIEELVKRHGYRALTDFV